MQNQDQKTEHKPKTAGEALCHSILPDVLWVIQPIDYQRYYERHAQAVIDWHEANAWKPISELPEAYRPVLLFHPDGNDSNELVWSGFWDDGDMPENGVSGWCDEQGIITDPVPTHWREYPAPPALPKEVAV